MPELPRLLLLLAVLLTAASTLTACNTAEGAGQDLSNAGHSLSNAAERNK